MGPRTSPFALSALLVVVPTSAAAQPRDPAGAEELFREARALVTNGDYTAACPKFAESQRLDPATGTLFNLADCEEHVGHAAEAWGDFLAAAEELSPGDERYAYASQHAAALEPTLAHLVIVVTGTARDTTTVTRDGVVVGEASLGVPLPVDAGAHAIVTSAPLHASRLVDVSLAPGQTRRIEVEPGESIERANLPRTLGYVALGVGAAGLAIGTYFGIRALSSQSDSEADCTAGVCRDARGISAHEDAQAFSRAADIGLAIGLSGVAAGCVLLLSSRAQVMPTASPSGAGASVRVAW
jgi:hypothetical protein